MEDSVCLKTRTHDQVSVLDKFSPEKLVMPAFEEGKLSARNNDNNNNNNNLFLKNTNRKYSFESHKL